MLPYDDCICPRFFACGQFSIRDGKLKHHFARSKPRTFIIPSLWYCEMGGMRVVNILQRVSQSLFVMPGTCWIAEAFEKLHWQTWRCVCLCVVTCRIRVAMTKNTSAAVLYCDFVAVSRRTSVAHMTAWSCVNVPLLMPYSSRSPFTLQFNRKFKRCVQSQQEYNPFLYT